MPSKITKRMTKEYVKMRLKEPKQAIRALVKIYSFQTAEEKATESSRCNNKMGFTGYDAEFLSKLAKQYQEKNWLSKKQIKVVTDIMPKYWRQIVESSNKVKLESQVLKQKETDEQQLSLKLGDKNG